MTSKWIDELLTIAKFDREQLEAAAETLNRIESILRKAMLSVDDENLSDEIRNEISRSTKKNS